MFQRVCSIVLLSIILTSAFLWSLSWWFSQYIWLCSTVIYSLLMKNKLQHYKSKILNSRSIYFKSKTIISHLWHLWFVIVITSNHVSCNNLHNCRLHPQYWLQRMFLLLRLWRSEYTLWIDYLYYCMGGYLKKG